MYMMISHILTYISGRESYRHLDHFIAGLCSAEPKPPLHHWYILVKQATTTLNLLHRSATNPKLSVEAHLNVEFVSNSIRMAPPGTKFFFFETPSDCGTWDHHGIEGKYVGHAPKHYCYYWCYIPKNRAERIAFIVEYPPRHEGTISIFS